MTTVTSTVPAVPAGLVTTICVAVLLTIVADARAEVHRRGVGQVRAGDRHRRAAGRRALPTGLMPVTAGAGT